MSTDKLRFTGTCMISISIISLAAALFYVGYEAAQIRLVIPEIVVETDKILTTLQPITEEREDGSNLISDIVNEVSAVRHAIPDILMTVNKTTTEIGAVNKNIPDIIAETSKIRSVLPDIMVRVDNTNYQIPAILERIDQINQNIPPIISQVEAVRMDVPIILDRADKLMADADELSKKAGEQAGKGAVSGAIKGIIGLPVDTSMKILRTPAGILRRNNNTNEKSDTKNED